MRVQNWTAEGKWHGSLFKNMAFFHLLIKFSNYHLWISCLSKIFLYNSIHSSFIRFFYFIKLVEWLIDFYWKLLYNASPSNVESNLLPLKFSLKLKRVSLKENVKKCYIFFFLRLVDKYYRLNEKFENDALRWQNCYSKENVQMYRSIETLKGHY